MISDLAGDGGLRLISLPEPTPSELRDSCAPSLPPSQTAGADRVDRSACGGGDPRRLYDVSQHTAGRPGAPLLAVQHTCTSFTIPRVGRILALLRGVS